MLSDLHKIGIKFHTVGSDDIPLTDFIPVFHRWIQQAGLDGTLVDVAEYSHVPAGPGTMLIAHDGNYAIDETGNRRGILYYSKHEVPGDSLEDRLAAVCRRNLAACRLLEEDDETRDRISVDYGSMEIFANDRLHAPNNDGTWTMFEPVLETFLGKLYPDAGYKVEREGADPRERFSVRVIIEDTASGADELLARL